MSLVPANMLGSVRTPIKGMKLMHVSHLSLLLFGWLEESLHACPLQSNMAHVMGWGQMAMGGCWPPA